MREGTYAEIGIDIPESKNGTAWTTGDYSTLASYPGEWAIINGAGLGLGATWPRQAVIMHPTGYGTTEVTQYTQYWKFERFEVTGGRAGFFLKGGPMWFRFLHIHDNGRDFGDSLQGGIVIPIARDSIIEYCWLENNEAPVGASSVIRNANNSNILLDADYRDSTANENRGLVFEPTAAIKGNVIRYNFIKGSFRGIRHKNQQRFGYNDRNPNDMTYSGWGDKVHHNIVLGASNDSIVVGQDFAQVYSNITDNTIQANQDGDQPIVYHVMVYNNTVIGAYNSFLTPSGVTTAGSVYANYYDSGLQKTVHPHVSFLNNISYGTGSGWHDIPFVLAWDMPSNTTNPGHDWQDLKVDRNLINQASQNTSFLIGHQYGSSYTGCQLQDQTTTDFNGCSSQWRGAGVTNWQNNNSGLFNGSSGAGQYIANGSFVLNGETTIANGGLGGSHPYLAGVNIPPYVGAANPNDNAWVNGVMGLENNMTLRAGAASDNPAWIEGNNVFSDTTPPSAPTGLGAP